MLKSHWPLVLALGAFFVITAVLLALSVARADGHFVYPLDDAYIHMAMARNFAERGVWGTSPDGFTSSSSSPLWTLLVALAYSLFGVNDLAPLTLNVLCAVLTHCVLYALLRRCGVDLRHTFLALMAVSLLAPLISIIFAGLEHTLHMLLTISFAYVSAKLLSRRTPARSQLYLLFVLAPLLTMTRYESLFLLLVVGFLLALRRRFLLPVALGAAGILPILIIGAVSLRHGWYFFPNTILLKGNIPHPGDLRTVFTAAYELTRLETTHVTALLVLAAVLAYKQYRRSTTLWSEPTLMTVIFILTTLLHLQFAQIGGFLRYEAYLVALGLFVTITTYRLQRREDSLTSSGKVLNPRGGRPLSLLLALVLGTPIVLRGVIALNVVPPATKNVYEQQYQMALFLGRFYKGSAIAANDIGAISYLSGVECVDLVGLTTREVGQARMNRTYNTRKIFEIAKERNVRIAMVYDEWIDGLGGVPQQWVQVGQWRISDNVVCGDDTVSIYATDPAEEHNLSQNLRAFASDLPQGVTQTGAYTR